MVAVSIVRQTTLAMEIRMWFRSWFAFPKTGSPWRRTSRTPRNRPAARVCPHLEVLEDRTLLSTVIGVTFDDGSGRLPELSVLSYSEGATGSPSATPSLQDFTLKLDPGSAEPALWGHLTAGKHLDSATIRVSKLVAGEEVQYLTYILSN